MRIRFIKLEDIKAEESVQLPVYSQNIGDHGTSYHRLYESGGYLFADVIYIRNDIEFEITTRRFRNNDLGINGDYYLGRGEYQSTEKEWLDALDRTIGFVGDIAKRSRST